MEKRKLNGEKILQGAKVIKWVFFGLILLFVIAGIVQLAGAVNPIDPASTPLGQLVYGDTLRNLVGIIAVVMVIIAGIVYAFDLGGGKQIGVAKDMLAAAIGGVLLFMFASWLLTQIGTIVPAPPPPADSNNGGLPNPASTGSGQTQGESDGGIIPSFPGQ